MEQQALQVVVETDLDENESKDTSTTDSRKHHDRGSVVLFESVPAKNQADNIAELNMLMCLLINMLKKVNMDEFIKFLKAKKDLIDQSYRKQNAAVSVFSGVSAAGGGLMVAGGAAALATLGASLGLVIAGGITVGLGTFGTIIAQMGGKFWRQLIIRQCKKELKQIESHTKEIDGTYKKFCSKCIEVIKILEEDEKNLEDLDPIIFKFALIGWLSTPKVAVAAASGAIAAGTNMATAAHASHFVHLKLLGKVVIPTFKLTQTFLGIGMAISGIGIVLDLVVGGKALFDLAKKTKCSESKNISKAIKQAEEHAELINSYLYLLDHNAEDLLRQVLDSVKSTQQLLDENRAEIEHLRRADDEKSAEIARLKEELLKFQQHNSLN